LVFLHKEIVELLTPHWAAHSGAQQHSEGASAGSSEGEAAALIMPICNTAVRSGRLWAAETPEQRAGTGMHGSV